jgi:EmrB/QacA subfamily drug resistance transporter
MADAAIDAEAREAATAPGQARAYASPRELYPAIGGLMLVLALASLDANIVGPALPRIVSDLGGLAHIAWVVTAFAVASTASTPLYGKLSDEYGRRPAFFVSIGLFLAGSVLCGVAHSMGMLIGARALQGVGAGGLMILAQTTIADLVPPRERGRYQGLVAGTFALCSVAGPLLGGVITDALSWRWIFFINLPVGVAALTILGLTLPAHAARARGRLDVAGFALIIAGTCTGMLLLSWGGNAFAWTSAPAIALGAATALLFGLLVPVERAAPEAALPPRLFADPVFVTGVVALSLAVMALFGSLVFVPLFFQAVLGLSATEAGLRMAPIMAGLIVSSVLGGRLVSRTGRYKRFPVAGLAVGTLAYLAMAWAVSHGTPANTFDALLVVLGLGLGLVMPNITTAVQNAVDQRDVGVATATLGFFRSLGGALGVAISGTILNVTLHAATAAPGSRSLLALGLSELRALPTPARAHLTGAYVQALAITFSAAAGVSALAFAVVLAMPERALRGRSPSG